LAKIVHHSLVLNGADIKGFFSAVLKVVYGFTGFFPGLLRPLNTELRRIEKRRNDAANTVSVVQKPFQPQIETKKTKKEGKKVFCVFTLWFFHQH
jgi:hypothetical protein